MLRIPALNMIVTILTYLLITKIIYSSTIFQAVFFSSIFICISLVSELIATVLIQNFLNATFSSMMSESIYLIIGVILSNLMLFLVLEILMKFLNLKVEIPKDNSFWYLGIFPVTSLLVIYNIKDFSLVITNSILFVIIIAILLSNLCICIVFTNVIKTKNIEAEIQMMKNREITDKFYQELVKQNNTYIHDFKKHIGIINEYLKDSEYKGLERYLNSLNYSLSPNKSVIVTGNKILDLVLNMNSDILNANRINLKVSVKPINTDFITDIDFNIILSNIIENAIESSKNSFEKNIIIKLDIVKTNIIFQVINSCEQVAPEFATLKTNKKKHGLGLGIIRNTVEKYNGFANFEYDQENSLFISTVFFVQ